MIGNNQPVKLSPVQQDNVSMAMRQLTQGRLVCGCGCNAFELFPVVAVFYNKINPIESSPQIVGHRFRCMDCQTFSAYDKTLNRWECGIKPPSAHDEPPPDLKLIV